MKPRTNFLLFITDQHCAEHLGAYGNEIVKTPHIDALARQGWRADRFHVATPICMPNRASIATGRMPSAHGVRLNGVPLAADSMTMMEALRVGGYRTQLVGKSHLQNMHTLPPPWKPAVSGPLIEARPRLPIAQDEEIDTCWDARGEVKARQPYFGFETTQFTIGHGDDLQGHYRLWLKQNHPEWANRLGPKHALPAPDYELVKAGQAWRTALPEELHPSAWIADQTIEALRAQANDQRPFFIQCSFPDPHHPFCPPGRYWDMYSPDDVQLPPTFDVANPPPHVQWLHRQRDEGKLNKAGHAVFAATEREVREAIALNYGSISFIDAQIGRVMAALRRFDLAEDTVVIFMSDHGDFMGDRQLLLKGPIHYQSLVRTPFIWSEPKGRHRGASDALTQAIDVAPTILERAGVGAYNGIQGKSLLPLIQGEALAVRNALLIEEEGQRTYLSFDQRVRARTLVTENHRFTVYDGADWGELYQRDADPHEQYNLWTDPAHNEIKRQLTESALRLMVSLTDTSPHPHSLA